jgi:hypothetical protein
MVVTDYEDMESSDMKSIENYVPQIQVRSGLRSGASEGGGYVNGVWYPDKSGVCGGSTTPPTTPQPPTQPPSGGGWIGGVWYPDKSGTCG